MASNQNVMIIVINNITIRIQVTHLEDIYTNFWLISLFDCVEHLYYNLAKGTDDKPWTKNL